MIKQDIKRAILTLIISQNEGGYVFDKADPGGETKFGVSKRSYPELDIKGLCLDQALSIYENDFVSRVPAEIFDVDIYYQYLDTSINCGPRVAQIIYFPGITGVEFRLLRKCYYMSLKNFLKYGKGWFNRVDRDIKRFIP